MVSDRASPVHWGFAVSRPPAGIATFGERNSCGVPASSPSSNVIFSARPVVFVTDRFPWAIERRLPLGPVTEAVRSLWFGWEAIMVMVAVRDADAWEAFARCAPRDAALPVAGAEPTVSVAGSKLMLSLPALASTSRP